MLKGMSSGERKRTSIGYELITDPPVCILDEPTSGLDSASAYKVIKNLRKLAKNEDKTIILSIHQPSSEMVMLFDKIICLSEGSKIYYGPGDHRLAQYFT